MRESPIGIFDSGVGGLTVFRALEERLPNESLIYLGDTARIPYGTRSPQTVVRYALEDAAFIESLQVKAMVIACNTASACAAEALRRECTVPVRSVIGPGARRAVEVTRNGHIGVIATEGTVASGAYERLIRRSRGVGRGARGVETAALYVVESGAEKKGEYGEQEGRAITVTSRACPLFVPLAEEGWAAHPVTRLVAEEYLGELRDAGIDTLVLGCTHYPILRRVIEEVLGDGVTLIDSGAALAEEVAQMLEANQLTRQDRAPRTERFFVTDSAQRFRRVAELFLGREIASLETIELGHL